MKVIWQLSISKRALFLSALVLSFVSFGFSQASQIGLSRQAALVSEFEVNGLKVLVKRRINAPTVALELFIRGGARNLNSENAGIENFMLEAAKEGSKDYPREIIRRELARTATAIGAGVNHDYSVLSLASTRENFDHSWKIFADVAINPAFESGDVERVREGILTGLRDVETDADNFLQISQDRVIYREHPYANDVSGSLESVRALQIKDLQDYHKRVMQTSQLLLVVVGDIDPQDLRKKISATLGKLPRGNYRENAYPALDFSKSTVDVVERVLPTNYVQGVFNAPPLGSKDYSAMRVAMTLLQSQIFQEVRVRRQLSYAPNAELNTLSANSAFIYVTAVDANQAVSVMLEQIKELKTRQIDQTVINNVGGHFLTLYYLDQQTSAAQGTELGKYELIGDGWRNSFDFLNRVLKVKPEDVQRVSRKYMKNIRFFVIGDPSAIDRSVFLGQKG